VPARPSLQVTALAGRSEMQRGNELYLNIKEVLMRRHVISTLRAASLAAIPAVLLVVSTGCNDESDATGPLGGHQIPAAQANLGAIPTDPILDIVSALTAAWAAKDAAAYAAPYAADL
jgi:hypothetical protein